jgi:hypothetical protein
MAKKKKAEEKIDAITNAGQAGAAGEVVQRYGEAVKEHLTSFSGVDNEPFLPKELPITLKGNPRGLKRISESKVNPAGNEYQQLKAQAGFAAELKEVARVNAEMIISKRPDRLVRTESIGKVNDPLIDVVYTSGSMFAGVQMKFVGKTPEEAVKRLLSKKFEKYYLVNDVYIAVPSDHYEGINRLLEGKIDELQTEIEYLSKKGGNELVQKKTAELKKVRELYYHLMKSRVSTKDAMEARLHPKLSVAKDIVKVSHRAGAEQAKYGLAISGGISLIKNIVSVVKGDKKTRTAALDVVKDTGTGTAASYVTAFSGSVIKGTMQNAQSVAIKNISKTNLPATMAVLTIETGKTLKKYFKGEIDGVECLQELGEKGTGVAASAMFATLGVTGSMVVFGKSAVIGQLLIPIPVIGGLIGSMLGYALSSALYAQLLGTLKEAKFAKEERAKIEAECLEAIRMIQEYRQELEKLTSEYLSGHIETFHHAFGEIKKALELDDIDGYIAGTNKLARKLKHKPPFETFGEFEILMRSADPLKL